MERAKKAVSIWGLCWRRSVGRTCLLIAPFEHRVPSIDFTCSNPYHRVYYRGRGAKTTSAPGGVASSDFPETPGIPEERTFISVFLALFVKHTRRGSCRTKWGRCPLSVTTPLSGRWGGNVQSIWNKEDRLHSKRSWAGARPRTDPRGRGVFARVRKKWNVYIYVRGFCENARVSCSSLLGQGDMERRHEKITAIVTIQTGTHNGSHAHTSLEMASHETILLTPF